MSAPSTQRNRQPAAFEPLDARLLTHPLDFVQAEHYRLRAVLTQLDWVAGAPPGEVRRKLARALLRYFAEDYPLHLADEEQDLFPLLRQRCAGDAAFAASLDALQEEHRKDEARLSDILAALRGLGAGRYRAEAPVGFVAEFRTFIETQRRHIAWENAVLLASARRCLRKPDLRRLSARFASRRGIKLAAPGPDPTPTARAAVG